MPANLLRAAKEALEGLDTNKIVEIYAKNFLFEDTSSGEQITDREALRKYFQQLFALPQASFTDIRVYEAECFAVLEWTWGGVSSTSGEPFNVRGASVIELSDGKVIRESIYYDPKPALS